MKTALLLVVLALVRVGGVASGTEPLEGIKADMAGADCCRFEFISILESTVFDSVDSTYGSALIAGDGRYRVGLGPDEYLRTSDRLYSYSAEQNQVTIEPVAGGPAPDESISFITRLDDHYATRVLSPGREYFLTRLDSAAVDLPDSMKVFLAAEPARLDRLEYFDQNEDLNRIVFLTSDLSPECEAAAFEPRYPDSTDVIKLY